MVEKLGLVIPPVVSYGALAAAIAALITGVGFYFDVTNRLSSLEARAQTLESSTGPALIQIQRSMARMEGQLDILLGERGRTFPYVPPPGPGTP